MGFHNLFLSGPQTPQCHMGTTGLQPGTLHLLVTPKFMTQAQYPLTSLCSQWWTWRGAAELEGTSNTNLLLPTALEPMHCIHHGYLQSHNPRTQIQETPDVAVTHAPRLKPRPPVPMGRNMGFPVLCLRGGVPK